MRSWGEEGEGWWAWEHPSGWRGLGVGGGCRKTINLTSTIRMLKITPLILAYNMLNCLTKIALSHFFETIPGRNCKQKKKPFPHFWAEGTFEGEGGGCILRNPPAAGILYAPPPPPLLYAPPPLEGYFEGWGGGGACIKFGPPTIR